MCHQFGGTSLFANHYLRLKQPATGIAHYFKPSTAGHHVFQTFLIINTSNHYVHLHQSSSTIKCSSLSTAAFDHPADLRHRHPTTTSIIPPVMNSIGGITNVFLFTRDPSSIVSSAIHHQATEITFPNHCSLPTLDTFTIRKHESECLSINELS